MIDRLSLLLHHIMTLAEPHELGATKLAKIIWFSDIEHYRRTGKTISMSDDYRKHAQGPLHRGFYAALRRLKAENYIAETINPTPVGARREYAVLTIPDLSIFTAEEIATVDRVVARIRPMSARAISDETHDVLWDEAYVNERIPVAAAAAVFGKCSPDILDWAKAELGANEHSPSG